LFRASNPEIDATTCKQTNVMEEENNVADT